MSYCFATIEVSGFNQITENIKSILQELTEIEEIMQREVDVALGVDQLFALVNHNCKIY